MSLLKRLRRMWLHFKRVQYAKDQLIAMPMPPAMRRVITAEGMPDGSTSLTQRIIDRQTGSLYRQDCTIILSAAAISGSAGKV